MLESKDSLIKESVQEPTFNMDGCWASPRNSLGSAALYDEAGESFEVGPFKDGEGSDGASEESGSSNTYDTYKPHKGNDNRGRAVQVVRARHGALGLEHFRLLKKLGCGDIGNVYLSELKGTGRSCFFAIKVMDKVALAARKKLVRAQTEREILQCLDHPFLPTLYAHFETEKLYCLVMEDCRGGDLHCLRRRQTRRLFPEHNARFYAAEVLLALEYLHMLGIIYRDLKPENVLGREDGHIMLSDFDLSLRCATNPTLVQSSKTPATSESSKSPILCTVQPVQEAQVQGPGVPPSEAPARAGRGADECPVDVVRGDSRVPGARDHQRATAMGVRSTGGRFGIFLYELLFGTTPFKGAGNRDTLFNIIGQPLRFPEAPCVGAPAKDLIRGLLVKDPLHRLGYERGAAQLKQHPFFQNVNWALIRCMDPATRHKAINGGAYFQRQLRCRRCRCECEAFR
ncbi:hypothetical protein CRG98_000450 [Punica granatum]|uniref:non-specific serine/threonine protein kinase n=1 Tax=Punica granatum TaxID=22663 RepID=A0A2I0LEQ1_PUNGR|nr:hypothetical protein CRG98_000450 [Punica granatum]